MHTRTRILTLFLVVLCSANVPAHAQEDRGQELYENHCVVCHDTNVHKRDNHLARNRDELRGWVAAWSSHSELGWNNADIDDVTRYMSRKLYKFTQ